MDDEEVMNEVPSSVGISGSEGENNSDKNLEKSDSLNEEKKVEAVEGDNSLPESEQCSELGKKKDLELEVGLELTEETVVILEEGVREAVHAEKVSLSLKDESPNGSVEIGRRGVKRARITVDDDHQPSVHFIYKSLTRASKKKLEELLQQWSQWHAKNVSSSNDPSEVLESGEETFFPALCVGHESASAVSFWMENQTMNDINKDVSPIDGNSVPLYDRGYALGLTSADGSTNADGGLEIIDAPSRCFNCGSYSHALRECTRPRDNVAVNNARKQLKSRRNQNSSSRNPTRYYQDSPAGKYDGLRPGALDDATRQLLGLGELDPPPWLNRMRELGYPPGYLDADEEDQPSGITIFTDKDMAEQEDGEIVGADSSKPKRKMSVEFPGINAPIPDKADERLWVPRPVVPLISTDISRNWSQQRSSSFGSRGHHREQRIGDLRDDGPPGDPGHSSSQYSFQPRFGSGLVSPNSMAEWSSRRSPLHEEESPKPFSFHSLHYSNPERHFSPLDRDSSGRHGNFSSGGMYDRDRDRDRDHSSRFSDRWSEDRRHHSRR
ncbi:Proline-rich spliceosome-associated (PSP) family protein / zinc knuckle (CCHC-type) family protein [Trifolium repens]|nr:Proline-rich spliceosome-associated (PSP) family protein / zinc knuckle (CCHC-type) family protein [Trifolium repens]